MVKDYYAILGAPAEASADDIQAAYRERVADYHSDQYGPDWEAFLEVQRAGRVLGNAEGRRAYDAARSWRQARAEEQDDREEGVRPTAEPLRPPSRPIAAAEFSLTESFGTYTPSPTEIFDRLWGNFSAAARPKAERLESLTIEIPLEPHEALRGGAVRVRLPARVRCPACGGAGAIRQYACWQCEGQGTVMGECPVSVPYPAGRFNCCVVQVPLHRHGIHNFYLTVRFCVSGPGLGGEVP